MTVTGNALFFAGDDGAHGLELYRLVPGGLPVSQGDMNPGAPAFVYVD